MYGDKKLFEGRYSNLERHKYDTMGIIVDVNIKSMVPLNDLAHLKLEGNDPITAGSVGMP